MAKITQHDLTIPRDSDFEFSVTFTDSLGTLITDVTDVQADIRMAEGGPIIASFTASPNPPTSGVTTLSLSRGDSVVLRQGLTYYYDVAYTRGGDVTRPIRGIITPEKERSDV